jgi:hypothetical protein
MSVPADAGEPASGASQNGVAGALLILLGSGGVVQGVRYGAGSAAAMGAGFLPIVASVGILAIGFGLLVDAFLRGGERVSAGRLRPAAAIGGSVLAFAVLIESGGLLVSAAAAVLIAAAGSSESRPPQTLLFAVLVAAAVALLFVQILGQPLDLVPGL